MYRGRFRKFTNSDRDSAASPHNHITTLLRVWEYRWLVIPPPPKKKDHSCCATWQADKSTSLYISMVTLFKMYCNDSKINCHFSVPGHVTVRLLGLSGICSVLAVWLKKIWREPWRHVVVLFKRQWTAWLMMFSEDVNCLKRSRLVERGTQLSYILLWHHKTWSALDTCSFYMSLRFIQPISTMLKDRVEKFVDSFLQKRIDI